MRGDDELRHGDWNKEEQRYEDGCREDRPHPDQQDDAAEPIVKWPASPRRRWHSPTVER